ncbi:hypothetical protein M513_11897, partial [Trichuris suis]
MLLRRRPKSLLDNLHPDSLEAYVRIQQENAVNLDVEGTQKPRTFQEGDRVWARDFHPFNSTKWVAGVIQPVISPRSFWVERAEEDLRVRRSIDHLRSRRTGEAPPDPVVDETPRGASLPTPFDDTPAPNEEGEQSCPGTVEETLGQGDRSTLTDQAAPAQLPTPNKEQMPEHRTALKERPARRIRRPKYSDDYVT